MKNLFRWLWSSGLWIGPKKRMEQAVEAVRRNDKAAITAYADWVAKHPCPEHVSSVVLECIARDRPAWVGVLAPHASPRCGRTAVQAAVKVAEKRRRCLSATSGSGETGAGVLERKVLRKKTSRSGPSVRMRRALVGLMAQMGVRDRCKLLKEVFSFGDSASLLVKDLLGAVRDPLDIPQTDRVDLLVLAACRQAGCRMSWVEPLAEDGEDVDQALVVLLEEAARNPGLLMSGHLLAMRRLMGLMDKNAVPSSACSLAWGLTFGWRWGRRIEERLRPRASPPEAFVLLCKKKHWGAAENLVNRQLLPAAALDRGLSLAPPEAPLPGARAQQAAFLLARSVPPRLTPPERMRRARL